MIFARKELRDSAIAQRTIHHRMTGEKSRDVVEEESALS